MSNHIVSSLVGRLRRERGTEQEKSGSSDHSAGADGALRPVTETGLAENNLGVHARYQAALANLSQRALEGTWLTSLMEEAVVLVGQTLAVDSCRVWERFGDARVVRLRGTAAWRDGSLDLSAAAQVVRAHAAYALQADRAIVVEDLAAEKRFDGTQMMFETGLHSGVCVIIRGADRVFGVIEAHSRTRRGFGQEDTDFLQAIANVLGAAIERKRAEMALRKSEEDFRGIVEHIQDVLYRVNKRGVLQMVSPSVDRYGYRAEELVGRNVGQFLGDRCERKRVLSGIVTALHENDSVNDFEFCLKGREGKSAVVSANAHWLRDAHGAVIGIEGMLRDITARKRAEEEIQELNRKLAQRVADLEEAQGKLIHSERMKALGVIAAGVAHELNNPIMGILNQIEYAISKTAEDGRVREVLWDALAHTRRCMRIVQDLLSYSRKDTGRNGERTSGDLSAAVREALRSADGLLKKADVQVHLRLQETPSVASLAESRMQQVVLNLILNARDAMAASKSRDLLIETWGDEDRITLRVRDTGAGMSEETRARIFEPFYTTKPPGSGTGLGLSLCKNLVESVGGRIEVESAPGMGTTFTVVIPAARRRDDGERGAAGLREIEVHE